MADSSQQQDESRGSPERWQRIQEILDQAWASGPAGWTAYLDQACAGDPALRAKVENLLLSLKVEKLLLSFEEPDDLFVPASPPFGGSPVVSPVASAVASDAPTAAPPGRTAPPTPTASLIGKSVGPFRIEEEIGKGTRGAVYRGVRTGDAADRVAIKVIKRGPDTDSLMRRFREDIPLLTGWSHPGIARFLDAGTINDGRPYFVTEFVEGQPIDRYCDERQLSIEDRLELFRKVCSAVEYGHRRLIVHRDIQPGTVLVTADGTPRLLEFGIARLLNSAPDEAPDAPTAAMLKLMTSDYASPEQTRGDTVTTASDVYSLGALLHVLLTGRPPHRSLGESDVDKPSVVVIEEGVKEGSPAKVSRRLAGDLDRIVLMALREEPEPRYSSVEKLSEDIRRHLEGLPLEGAGSRTQGAVSFVKRHTRAVAVAALLVLALVAAVPVAVWKTRAASENAAAVLSLERELASAYERLGDYQKSLPLRQAVAANPGATPDDQLALGALYSVLSGTLGAAEDGRRAVAILEGLRAKSPHDDRILGVLQRAYEAAGDAAGKDAGHLGEAADFHSKAIVLAQQRAGTDPHLMAVYLVKLGNDRRRLGDRRGALQAYNRARDIFQTLAGNTPKPEQRRDLAGIAAAIGDTLAMDGNGKDALSAYTIGLHHRKDLADAEPANPAALADLGWAYAGMGTAFYVIGDMPYARDEFTAAREAIGRAAARDPGNAGLQDMLAMLAIRIGQVNEKAALIPEALVEYRAALAIFQARAAKDPDARLNVAAAQLRTGHAQMRLKALATAESYQKALAIVEPVAGRDHADQRALYTAADSYSGLAEVMAAADPNGARAMLQRSLAVWRKIPNPARLAPGGFDVGNPKDVETRLAALRK